MKTPALPIDEVLPEVARALEQARRVVVQAPPGAGKTTRIPEFLIDRSPNDSIVVVEPRRLAARLAARHVAQQRQEPVGDKIGYQVRFDSAVGPKTRVRYVTEGVFLRQLLQNPTIDDVTIVLLDEFHERHLVGDLALSWLAKLQREQRPDLKLGVMSATLETESVSTFLNPCPVVSSHGKRYPVDVTHQLRPDDRPLHLRVASAVRQAVNEEPDGDILVFLPGAAEIRRASGACQPVADTLDLSIVALHGNLTHEEQDRALASHGRRKVILSTNVAESSVTIDGVVAVVDTGLARVAAHAPWSGLPTLRVSPISQASAAQRAGRAGRTRPGRCIRLYTEADLLRRPAHLPPEVQRMDLTDTALALRGLGVEDPTSFSWFESPGEASWQAADTLLRQLGAIDDRGAITRMGRDMVTYPVHPRVARILVEAKQRGVSRQAAIVGALIGQRSLSLSQRSNVSPNAERRGPLSIDLLDAVESYRQAARARFEPHRLRSMGIDHRAARDVQKLQRQLHAVGRSSQPEPSDAEDQLRICILAGYPDRVARRVHRRDVALVGGGSARLAVDPDAPVPELMVAVEAEERRDGRSRRLEVRSICQVEPLWLLDLFPDEIDESEQHRWNADRGCVESLERLTYRGLVLDEVKRQDNRSEQVSAILFEAARGIGVHSFAPEGALDSFLCRVAFVREHAPRANVPSLDVTDAERVLRALCAGLRCIKELHEAGLLQAMQAELDPGARRAIDRLAPQRIRLPGGRDLPIHYERDRPPWASSRLQDFFGLVDGPKLVDDRVPVVLHLLAPNRRAVQVTSDLAGFWENHYPKLRRQLCRRYPKHAWPEDGRTARPPPPGKLR